MNTKTEIFKDFERIGVKPDKKADRYIYNGLMCEYKDYEIIFYHAGGSLSIKDYEENLSDNYVKFTDKETKLLLKYGVEKVSDNFKKIRSIVKSNIFNKQLDLLGSIELQELNQELTLN